jgi:uncharacterized membrane protein YbhN (UPF0104 family)
MRSVPTIVVQSSRARSRLRIPWRALRVVCSGGALLWIVRATPLSAIAATLHRADWLWLTLGFALNLLARVAAAERTFVISRALGLGASRRQTLQTLFISNYYALLSPGPVLSGVVSVYRYKSQGATLTGSISTLLGSRAVEAAVFIVIGAACVLIDSRISLTAVRIPLSLALVAGILFGIGLTGWSLLHRRQAGLLVAGIAVKPSGGGRFSQTLAVWHELLRHGPLMACTAAVPAAAQAVLSGAAVSLLAKALDIDLSLVTSIWICAAVYAVVLLPISIAGLGVRDLTLIKSFALLGLAPQLAVALSVLLLADPLLNAMIGGVWQMTSIMGGPRKHA